MERAKQLVEEGRILGNKVKGKRKHYADFPKVLWQGKHEGRETLVMQMLGPCLLDLFLDCGRQFSHKSIYMLAEELLSAVEFLHNAGYLHRDIKPDNICIGIGAQENCLYLIDFGLSRKYAKKGKHVSCDTQVPFQGNCYWASSNVLKGFSASRRDDLESLMYVLLYLFQGSLPWYVSNEKRCHQSIVLDRRSAISITDMCRNTSPALPLALTYIKSLSFSSTPRYDYLKSLFRDAALQSGINHYDFVFDWQISPHGMKVDCRLDDINMMRSDEHSAKSQDWEKKTKKSRGSENSERARTAKRKRSDEEFTGKGESLRVKLEKLDSSSTQSPGQLMKQCNSRASSPRQSIAHSPIDMMAMARPTEAHSQNDIISRRQLHTSSPRKIPFAIDLHEVVLEPNESEDTTPKARNPLSLQRFRQRYEEYKAKAGCSNVL